MLGFVFLYIDIVVPGRTGGDGGWVLIGIAIYGSAILITKTSLAAWYHFKWIIFERCCGNYEADLDRQAKVDEYWRVHEDQWILDHPPEPEMHEREEMMSKGDKSSKLSQIKGSHAKASKAEEVKAN